MADPDGPDQRVTLHCTGCWAAEYGNRLNLTLRGAGPGDPAGQGAGHFLLHVHRRGTLVRKADLIRLCEAHPDCAFMAFTNGTLVDQAFCDDLKRVGNLYLAISLEGQRGRSTTREEAAVSIKRSWVPWTC